MVALSFALPDFGTALSTFFLYTASLWKPYRNGTTAITTSRCATLTKLSRTQCWQISHAIQILKNTVLQSLLGVLEHATGSPLVNQAHLLHWHPLAHAGVLSSRLFKCRTSPLWRAVCIGYFTVNKEDSGAAHWRTTVRRSRQPCHSISQVKQ